MYYRYEYDEKGQLIREDNRPLNRTFLYSYDDAGNILTSVSYVLSLGVEDFSALNKLTNHRFNYDANGRLSEYVGKGSFTYDSIGNPIKYRGRTLTWKNGRQLATFTRSGVTYEFDYNADGIRTYKAGGGLTTQYVLNGSQVMRQIINDGTTNYIADYIYHENGTPMAFAYYQEGNAPVYYFYELNLQGDIIAIYNENGSKIVGFRYDAWGGFNTDKANTTVCTDIFLRASLFRYRSYIYDYETDLYYLQSRYYDPEIGRFINVDGVIANVGSLHGYNTYSYCFNNPINLSDSTGGWPEFIEDAVNWIKDNIITPIADDFKNFNMANTSEQVVLDATIFSAYKDTFVLKVPIGDNAFSIGILVIGNGVSLKNDIKHEYGHKVQLDNMGWGKYLLDVALPSITAYALDSMGKLPYSYYGSPWESEADTLGGVNRTTNNTPWPQGSYSSYWDLIKLFF